MAQEFTRLARLATMLAGFAVLAACGGGGGGGLGDGGGGGGGSNPAPTVSLSASLNSIASGQTVTLTWSSSNATSCTASGGWSGARATSGTEATPALTAATTFTLTCTGSGGSSSASTTVSIIGPPAVTFTATQTALTENYSTTLAWNATNATSCTASNTGGGDFTGTKSAFGADATGPISADTSYTLTCTGPGGTDSASVNVTVSAPPAGQVVLFGKVTFDRLPFNATAEAGLNGSQPIVSPAREVLVDVTGGATVSTTTDAGGYYAVNVPVGASVQVNVRAQMQKTGAAPTWNFRVLNNFNSDALYTLVGSTAVPTVDVARNLHAASGWGGSSYTGTRAAAPFAILDTVYNTKQLILSADSTATFPDLDLYWSTQNRTANSPFCPDTGNIGTSFYFNDPSGNTEDGCTPSAPLPAGIYILGDYANGNGDTDEFDSHVIAHEFGHYFEDQFSRSDSIGGQHGGGDLLDLRVAFGEGWGNAFGAMSLNDPQYRDSSQGISQDFGFNLETGTTQGEGWFSEASVGEFLWDVFDNEAESGDGVALGFGPIYEVMTNEQVNTDALTSIFSFGAALRANTGSAVGTLLGREEINGSDAFGTGETNNGGDARALPVYDTITLNSPKNNVCSSSVDGNSDGNKLGNHRFLRFENNASRLVTITAQGATTAAGTTAATDPDILVFRRGMIELSGESATPGSETISQRTLASGTYILDVYDFDVFDAGATQPRCMTITISGN